MAALRHKTRKGAAVSCRREGGGRPRQREGNYHMKRLALCVLLLVFFGACALTTDEVSLEYRSATPQNVVAAANAVKVQVTATEGRVSNLDKVSVKKNGYGMEMASIISTQSLPDLVRSAIEQELSKEGFQIGLSPVLVNVELIKFYNDFKVGWWSGNAVSEVTIAVQVETATDGRIWYSRSVSSGADEGGVMLASGNNAKLSLDKAFSASIARLMSDANFTQAILSASHSQAEGRPSSGLGSVDYIDPHYVA